MITRLDAACAAMLADPDDDAARLRYYAHLADGELFMLLEHEQPGDAITPRLFDLEEGPVVLAFDQEERLSAFTGIAAPYAALPGRVIARQLAGQGVGLAVNLGVAGTAWIVTPEAIDWLAETLDTAPDRHEARPVAFHAPGGLPEALLSALDAKLARAGGLAVAAVLARVEYDDGRRGHMLAFIDAQPDAEQALARAAAEALTFSGIEAGEMDVAFVGSDTAAATAILRSGLRFDLPAPDGLAKARQSANGPLANGAAGDGQVGPGMDPSKPPRLR